MHFTCLCYFKDCARLHGNHISLTIVMRSTHTHTRHTRDTHYCLTCKSEVSKSSNGVFLFFQNVPPDLSICTFVLEQSLSVRALQEMLANTEEKAEGVSVKRRVWTHTHTHSRLLSGQGFLQVRQQPDETQMGGSSRLLSDLFILGWSHLHASLCQVFASTNEQFKAAWRRLQSINTVFPNTSSTVVSDCWLDHLWVP